jgi:hypothetical protein
MGGTGPYLPPDPVTSLLGNGPSAQVRTDDDQGFLRVPGTSATWHPGTTAQTTTQDSVDPSAWNLTSLGQAKEWLQNHAEFLVRVRQRMAEIEGFIGGPASSRDGATSALGGFEEATQLKAKHDGLYTGMRTGLETIIEDLYDSADALGRVIDRYASVEQQNELTAAQWQSIFGEGSGSKHDILPDSNPEPRAV